MGFSQEDKIDDELDKRYPLLFKLNESGSKFLSLTIWNTFRAGIKKIGTRDQKNFLDFKGSNIFVYGQFSPRFMVMTSIGSRSFNAQNTGVDGESKAMVFLNDATGEYMVIDKKMYIGLGLHYWCGISRAQVGSGNSAMTMGGPNDRVWLNYGRTGQAVREIGVFIKGSLSDKLKYSFTINDSENSYVVNDDTPISKDVSAYAGAYISPKVSNSEKSRLNYTSRLEYQFLDEEGDKFPFKSGSTFSKKGNVFNVGAGIWYHPNASITLRDKLSPITKISEIKNVNQIEYQDALHFSVDAYLDMKGLTAYALFQDTNYGKNARGYRFTGSNTTLTLGYFLEDFNLQPYASYSFLHPRVDGYNSGWDMKLGINLLKLDIFLRASLEYKINKSVEDTSLNKSLILQVQFVI
ncbi:phosphate-selective porin O and P [Ichthyobacterium seriolicida]|uniref:Phosphate-selective porin O and P n=2 Tax=Ichthyobacterium seriolicida TaxID=242600 RepID=A0A1J1DX55_9FLAO|nr:phosphate-selective porin O and P [Ichthyobacterium seriolicida]